ncbi:MAG: DUF4912 domain-containing protein [Planctomycetota bacterium]|nr:DUF4912 domain-containing protein [Planctomycetota bacterium]
MSRTELKSKTVKELGQKAKDLGITGYASMRKPELITALSNKLRAIKAAKTRAKNARGSSRKSKKRIASKRASSSRRNVAHLNGQVASGNQRGVFSKLLMDPAEKDRLKDLSIGRAFSRNGSKGRASRDRVVLLVRDSYWIQVCWEVKQRCVSRAQAAMGQHWHSARPIIRLYEIEDGAKNVHGSRIVRDIEIHGGVSNWYVDVEHPPALYQVELGYLSASGMFHALCRSNTVTTPTPGSCDAIDSNWSDIAEDYKRVFALSGGNTNEQGSQDLKELFEQRLQRPMSKSVVMQYGLSTEDGEQELHFEVDSELIVFGNAESDAVVTMAGEPVKLAKDGSFTVRMDLSNRRKVIPVVANAADGIRQKTVVIAIERNTKILEVTKQDRDA